jgi:hypothetical protein
VTHDCLVQNSGFEAQIIADLRVILGVLPRQRYWGASGGLMEIQISTLIGWDDILSLQDEITYVI